VNWTRLVGLPANSVNAIVQTDDGYLWLGTQNGLVRFNGKEFKLFELPIRPAFLSRSISKLSKSRDGLWFGLGGGSFGYFGRDGFGSYEKEPWGNPWMEVTAIRELSDGSVWVGAAKSSVRWIPGNAAKTYTNDQVVGINVVVEGKGGRVWLGTSSQGLWLWENGKMRAFPDPALMRRNIKSLAEDALGQIWVGTDQGLRCYDSALRPVATSNLNIDVCALLLDRHGVLWIGTRRTGLFRLYNGRVTQLQKTDGLVNNNVSALLEDREGSLWIGTQDGLSKISDIKLPLYSGPEGFPEEAMHHDVCASEKGGLWTATSRGIQYYDGSSTANWMADGLSNPYTKRVFEARGGNLYVINGIKEIQVLSNGNTAATLECKDWPTAFAEDNHGVVVAVASELFRVGTAGLRPYSYQANAKPDYGWVRNLWGCPDGSILVATTAGCFRVRDGAIEHWSTAEGLPVADVLWVSKDDEEVIWMGLAKGLAWIKDGKVYSATRGHRAFLNDITCILPDNRNGLWMNSRQGIFRVRREDLYDFAQGKSKSIECASYDGLESVKTTDSTEVENSGCKTADGRIWFPTPLGLLMIDAEHLAINKLPPPIHIEQVRINGVEVIGTNQAAIRPGRGDVEIQYAALTFIAPQKVRFRYRLEGYEPDWIEVAGRQTTFYTNLKPGKYRFQVQACNADGIWNTDGDSVEIELPPHFYQTTPFRVFCGVLGATGLLGVYLWRVRLLHRRQQELEEANEHLETTVRQRTRELEEQVFAKERAHHELAEAQQEVMLSSRKAGMAEVAIGVLHNVGNVLNSVNVSTILIREKLRNSAVGSLIKLGGLLRQHEADIAAFLTADPKGKLVPLFIIQLADQMGAEHRVMQQEQDQLTRNIEHIKEIVAMQQNYAQVSVILEHVSLANLVDEALQINAAALAREGVRIVRHYSDVPGTMADRHKVLQILVNLVNNAKHALSGAGHPDKRLTVSIGMNGSNRLKVSVTDNGVGIPKENLTRIFSHGFSTRKAGHGFGLHNGANAAKEMGGQLSVHSEGLGKGTTFTLELSSIERKPEPNVEPGAVPSGEPGREHE
jgi:ligand-binding sensor domain-containing protein/signal transduction histidine kinase